MFNEKIKIFSSIKSIKYFLYNKKGFLFAMMHPGMMFLIGLIIGAVLIYILVSKGIIPTGLLPF